MPLPPLLTNATVPAPYACHCRLSQSPRPFSTISVRLAALLTFRECHGSFYLFAPQHQRPTANGEAAFFTIRRTSQSTSNNLVYCCVYRRCISHGSVSLGTRPRSFNFNQKSMPFIYKSALL